MQQDSSPPPRSAPIAMGREEFRRIGHRLVDEISDVLDTLADRPVSPGETPTAVRALLRSDDTLPETGSDPATLMAEATRLLVDHSLYNGHPRFFGYITAPPAPIGILGDFLASAINANVGAWTLAPAASEIEAQTVRWIAELLSYPTTCGGLLVSGGNMANMVGLWAARAAMSVGDLRKAGTGAERLRVYVSDETHTWIQKGADLSGLGTDAVRWIPTDGDLRMDVDALRRRIREDRAAVEHPFMVVGTGGSVSTGAIDPLADIASLCRDECLWFHVDGAYGGFAAATTEAPDDLRALSQADSVAVDPHKWLYAPLEAGCILVKDPDHLRNAFAYHPPYYHFGVEAVNHVDYGPQNSRGFRALKVWLALKHVGRSGYVEMISEDMRLARILYECADAHPDLEATGQGLSITTLRYVPRDLQGIEGPTDVDSYLNDLNREIQARLETGGEAFVSNAVVRGRYLLRACIVNFNTGRGDVEALPDIIARVGAHADADMRAKGLPG